MKKSTPSWPTLNEWNEWYESPLGQRLLFLEQQQIDLCLPKVFGYHAVCLGVQEPFSFERCMVSHKLEIAPEFLPQTRANVLSNYETLPFVDQSIDLFILPHTLEFSENPAKILKEVSRCLMPEGHLFILGFNAGSLFGLWRWLQGNSTRFPWRGNFYSPRKLCRWLEDAELSVQVENTFYFRPPFQEVGPLKKLKFLEVLGPLVLGGSGGAYAMLVKKEVAGLTPIREFKKIVAPVKDWVAAHRESINGRV